MTKLLSIILLIFVTATANGQEKQMWACTETQSTGFSWIDETWVAETFYKGNHLLTIDGAESVLRDNGLDYPMECSYAASYNSCSNSTQLLVLKVSTGFAAYSSLSAAIRNGNGDESVAVSILHCTKI